MLEIHKSEKKDADKDKLHGLAYTRRWNVVDFMGKYHLSRFENKEIPMPGTQVKLERQHLKSKEEDLVRFQRELKYRSEKRIRHNDMKMKMVDFSTNIYFDTVIGSQIHASETILNEREQILYTRTKRFDSKVDIEEFFDHVRQGKHHYVAHAIRGGYNSINYQDPDTGDCCLHVAAARGYPKVVEELLLYRAEPDVKNNYCNYPIHNCWRFWSFDKFRTKEEREDQENRTCEMLHHFLSFGAFVNATDIDGQTCLHIACRYNTVRIVKLLLFFRADVNLQTRRGHTPLDVAERCGHKNVYGLVTMFTGLGKTMVHFDFSILWQKFLEDIEAALVDGPSADKFLFELSMQEKVKSVAKQLRTRSMPIDDELLRHAFHESMSCPYSVKPWDADWKGFVADYTAKMKKNTSKLEVARSTAVSVMSDGLDSKDNKSNLKAGSNSTAAAHDHDAGHNKKEDTLSPLKSPDKKKIMGPFSPAGKHSSDSSFARTSSLSQVRTAALESASSPIRAGSTLPPSASSSLSSMSTRDSHSQQKRRKLPALPVPEPRPKSAYSADLVGSSRNMLVHLWGAAPVVTHEDYRYGQEITKEAAVDELGDSLGPMLTVTTARRPTARGEGPSSSRGGEGHSKALGEGDHSTSANTNTISGSSNNNNNNPSSSRVENSARKHGAHPHLQSRGSFDLPLQDSFSDFAPDTSMREVAEDELGDSLGPMLHLTTRRPTRDGGHPHTGPLFQHQRSFEEEDATNGGGNGALGLHLNLSGVTHNHRSIVSPFDSSPMKFHLQSRGSFELPTQGSFDMPALPTQGSFDVSRQGSFDFSRQASFDLPKQGSFDFSRQASFDLPAQASFNLAAQGSFNLPTQGSFDFSSNEHSQQQAVPRVMLSAFSTYSSDDPNDFGVVHLQKPNHKSSPEVSGRLQHSNTAGSGSDGSEKSSQPVDEMRPSVFTFSSKSNTFSLNTFSHSDKGDFSVQSAKLSDVSSTKSSEDSGTNDTMTAATISAKLMNGIEKFEAMSRKLTNIAGLTSDGENSNSSSLLSPKVGKSSSALRRRGSAGDIAEMQAWSPTKGQKEIANLKAFSTKLSKPADKPLELLADGSYKSKLLPSPSGKVVTVEGDGSHTARDGNTTARKDATTTDGSSTARGAKASARDGPPSSTTRVRRRSAEDVLSMRTPDRNGNEFQSTRRKSQASQRRGSASNNNSPSRRETAPGTAAKGGHGLSETESDGSQSVRKSSRSSVKMDPHAIARTRRKTRERVSKKNRSTKQTSLVGMSQKPRNLLGALSTKILSPKSKSDDEEEYTDDHTDEETPTAATVVATDGSDTQRERNVWETMFIDENDVNGGSSQGRPMSQLRARGVACARAVLLDGLFESTTKRPSTQSSLMISHRKPEAPLRDTEEQQSIVRAITSQGKDFDAYESSLSLIPKHLRMLQYTEKANEKTILGEYLPITVEYRSQARDDMFSRLVMKPKEKAIAPSVQSIKRPEGRFGRNTESGEDSTGVQVMAGSLEEGLDTNASEGTDDFEEDQKNASSKGEGGGKGKPILHEIRRQQIDLVNGKRARFVEKKLLPPSRVSSVVEQMASEYRAKMEKEKQRRLGLSGGGTLKAKNDLAASLQGGHGTVVGDHSKHAKTPEMELRGQDSAGLQAKANMLLAAPTVKYGRGRLMSTHMAKVRLEDPWSTVPGR
jgi:hypothetical protein